MSEEPPPYDLVDLIRENKEEKKIDLPSTWFLPIAAVSFGFILGSLVFRRTGLSSKEEFTMGFDFLNLGAAAENLSRRSKPYSVLLFVPKDENIPAIFQGSGEIYIIGQEGTPTIGKITTSPEIKLHLCNVKMNQ